MRNLRLVLDFYHPWPNSIGFYNARRLGTVNGLRFVIMDPFYGDSLDSLLQGEGDIAISYPNRFLDRVSRGSDLVALFPIVTQPLESLYYEGKKKSDIFKSLAGARVGYRKSPRLRAILEDMNKKNLASCPMNLVEIYPEEPMPSDLGSKIDFCFGALYAWEGLFSEGRVISCHTFPELGIPSYPGQILVTTREFYEKNELDLKLWKEGIRRGYLHSLENLSESASVIHEFIPYFPKEIVLKSLEVLVDYLPNSESWGVWNWEALEEYQEFLVSNKLLTNSMDLKSYFR